MVKERTAEPGPPRYRVCSLLPLAAGGAMKQVRFKKGVRDAGVLAIDPSREGLTGAVAVHALVVHAKGQKVPALETGRR